MVIQVCLRAQDNGAPGSFYWSEVNYFSSYLILSPILWFGNCTISRLKPPPFYSNLNVKRLAWEWDESYVMLSDLLICQTRFMIETIFSPKYAGFCFYTHKHMGGNLSSWDDDELSDPKYFNSF